jgi:protein-S-isoprenylcysteine O-methyltransferase Ste14
MAYALLTLSVVLGGGSLLVFAVHLYAGSLDLVRLDLPEASRLALDAGLSLAFFLQHSVMVRGPVRERLRRGMPAAFYPAIYSITSGLVLLLVVALWQQSSVVLVEFEGGARWGLRGVFVLGLAGFLWGERALGSLDALGTREIARYLRGRKRKTLPLAARGPYRWVRHPLYLFTLLLIWSCPDLTADRLLFNLLWSGWIFLGAVLEERDLVAEFGMPYEEYRRRVPMLLPWRGPRRGPDSGAI